MTTSISDLAKQARTTFEPGTPSEYTYFDRQKFAELIIDLAVECVRDELRDPDSTLTYDQCSRLQNRIREQFQKE